MHSMAVLIAGAAVLVAATFVLPGHDLVFSLLATAWFVLWVVLRARGSAGERGRGATASGSGYAIADGAAMSPTGFGGPGHAGDAGHAGSCGDGGGGADGGGGDGSC
jgi:hypothetical protein